MRACCFRIGIIASILAMWLAGCGANGANGYGGAEPEEEYQSFAQRELAELIEQGVQEQLPPPLSNEALELYALELHRQNVYLEAVGEAREALAPVAIAASLFAVEGAVDFLLNVVPADKLGDAYRAGKKALALRKKNKRADELVGLMQELDRKLDGDEQQILRLAMRLRRAERKALQVIHKHTRSPAVLRALMEKHLRHQVDVRWIAKKLEQNKLDGAFVRRFTFDADLVSEFTLHSAHPSWRTLQRVVEGQPVDQEARSALARKVKGLLGERAAAKQVDEMKFRERYLQRPDSWFDVGRGVGYGNNRSLDIVAYGDKDEMLVAEVKNWAADTWSNSSSRAQVLRQLEQHNEGAEIIRKQTFPRRKLAGKVLMIVDEGFFDAMSSKTRKKFSAEVKKRGWDIEYISSQGIDDFRTFIKDLR